MQKLTNAILWRRAVSLLAAATANCLTQPAQAQDAVQPPNQETIKAPAHPTFPPTAPETETSFVESSDLAQFFFAKDNLPDSFYDKLQAEKEKYHLAISVGANHWFHLDRDERIYGNGYGVPTESGTYYWYIAADPSFKFKGGPINEIGAHVQFRFRDDKHDKLRAFYYNTYWFYEAYAYGKTDFGTFKAGEIVTQFGIAWDGSWWEGVPYFDGYKFDPDYGISWERTWKPSDRFSVDSTAQFFFASDRVNGSIPGADAESADGERNTGVVRLVPTWTIDEQTKLAWGISGLVGGIKGSRPGADDTRSAFGTDLTLTIGNFSVFGEYIDGFGVANPVRYVSGGPSDRVDSLRGGVAYKYGPVTFHVNYSYGWDHNPQGHQYVFDPGLNVQLTKNLILYAEYVKWDVTDRNDITSKFDDGFELILVWNL
jgi:hypothetical protein